MPDFASQLNEVWAAAERKDGRQYTLEEVAQAITRAGVPITRQYLSQLRTGDRTNPSDKVRDAISKFFGFENPSYFDESTAGEELRRQLNEFLAWKASGLLDVLRDAGALGVAFARDAADLPESDVAALQQIAGRMRQAAGLPVNDFSER